MKRQMIIHLCNYIPEIESNIHACLFDQKMSIKEWCQSMASEDSMVNMLGMYVLRETLGVSNISNYQYL